MKKLLFALSALVSAAVLQAEQLDHWLYADGKITDGAWTFAASADRNNKMTVGQVSEVAGEYPTVPTPLDFSKPVTDASGASYVISTLDCKFIDNSKSYAAREPAQYVSALTLPGEGLTRISDYSLGKLVNAVGTLHFPASLTSFGRMAFQEDAQLTVAGSEFANVKSLTSGDAFKNVNITGELDLRKLEGRVENNSFAGTKITSVLFGPGLTELLGGYADGAFVNCTKLKSVIFDPDSSVTIGSGGVFRSCTALEEIDLRAVEKLYDAGKNSQEYAPFSICTGLKKVVLGGKMVQWDYSVFAGCSSLSEAHYYGAPSASIGSPVFWKAGDNRKISTFVHLDPSDTAAKTAWDAYTAGGELNENDSCWRDDMIAGSTVELRPLLLYTQKSISLAKGVDADMESGVIGTFIVSRAEGDSLAGAVDVAYELSGTAENGVDYEKLSGVISIPGGERSVELQVIPRFVGAVSTKDVTVTLAEGDYEIVAGEDSATISVSSCYRSVSVAKLVDADEGKGTYGYFEISRGENDAVTAPLTVSFEVSGTAIPKKTYRPLESPVVIPAGERSVRLRVAPLDDPETTTDTTVVVAVTGDNYAIEGGPATMTVVNGSTFGGWKLYSNYMTDGVWKFTVQQNDRDDRRYPDGVNHLYVQDLQEFPKEPAELNFDKVIINCANDRPHAIREFQQPLKTAAAVLKSVVLPNDDRYPFKLVGDFFKDCSSLESITPLLPKCCVSVGRDCFSNLSSLQNTDLYFYGSDFGEAVSCWGVIQNCLSVTNVDLSASTITALRRDCFNGCKNLKTVILPPTCQELGAHEGDGMTDRTPFGGTDMNVKLIVTGNTLPLISCGTYCIGAIEFTKPINELSDNAFVNCRHASFGTRFNSITFVGPPPTEIGETIFDGHKECSITINVPNYYIADWRKIADNGVLTKKDGGTWTSGTKQLLATYGESRQGLMVIVR